MHFISASDRPSLSDIWHGARRLAFHTIRRKKYGELQHKRGIFDRYRCVFVHVPKCAGSAVVQSLFGDFDCGHTSLKRYQIMFPPMEFYNYFKFTFVRNPFDRLVSAYFFLQNGGLNEKDRCWAQRRLACFKSFEDFVIRWVTPFNVARALHFRPQSRFVCLGGVVPAVDFVGRFENIERDFEFIARRLGISATLGEFNRNPCRSKDYRSYYTDRTREIVERVYAEDLRILGYGF